jgi:hypothetical protein
MIKSLLTEKQNDEEIEQRTEGNLSGQEKLSRLCGLSFGFLCLGVVNSYEFHLDKMINIFLQLIVK